MHTSSLSLYYYEVPYRLSNDFEELDLERLEMPFNANDLFSSPI